MKVLVVGATGQVGFRICATLARNGHQVRGLVRSGSTRADELRKAGVEVFTGDLADAASLEAACQGVNAVVSSATAMISAGTGNSLAAIDRDGHLALVAAAAKNKVQKIVYVSVSPNLPEAGCVLTGYKRTVERAIRASGLKWTILQPTPFMEIWLGPKLGWNLREGTVKLFGSGTAPFSWISLEDVAAYAVASITAAKSDNQDIPLGGPEAISAIDVVKIFERISGRKFRVTHLPGAMPKILSVVLRPFNPKLAAGMQLFAKSRSGDVIDMTKARSIYGLPATSVADYATQQFKV